MTPATMAAETKPSSPEHACPECGARDWRWNPNSRAARTPGSGSWRCHPCSAQQQRAYRLQVSGRHPCPRCGQPALRHRECADCQRRRHAALGLKKMDPAYAEVLRARLDETTLTYFLANFNKGKVRYPVPSSLFPGLDPALDTLLKRLGRDRDVALCRTMAALPVEDQRYYLQRAVGNLTEAERWARVPRWQRPILAGDEQDRHIWKYFTMLRLSMEQAAADAPPWTMASQGALLARMAGTLEYITDRRRLSAVLYEYGRMLRDGLDVGDVVHPPWEATLHQEARS